MARLGSCGARACCERRAADCCVLLAGAEAHGRIDERYIVGRYARTLTCERLVGF